MVSGVVVKLCRTKNMVKVEFKKLEAVCRSASESHWILPLHASVYLHESGPVPSRFLNADTQKWQVPWVKDHE